VTGAPTIRVVDKQATGAAAVGAIATGAAAIGSFALGALAVGAVAVGAVAIGALKVGRARLERLEIGRLKVGYLDIADIEDAFDGVTALVRLRAAPGRGDALARLLAQMPDDRAGLLDRPQRSTADPDLFLLTARYADEHAFAEDAASPWLAMFRRRLALEGLALASPDEPLDVTLYRPVA
jgi:hypothetical protein